MVLKKITNFRNPPFLPPNSFLKTIYFFYVSEMTGTHGSLILIFSLKTRIDGSLIMKFS